MARDTRIGNGDDDAVSPWATNQPVTPTPVEFAWARAADERVQPTAPGEAAVAMQSGGRPIEAGAPNERPDSTPPETSSDGDRRRTAVIVAATVVGLLGVVGALTMLGDGSGGEPAASEPAITEPATDDELPSPESSTIDTEPIEAGPPTSDLVVPAEPARDDGPVGPVGENDGIEPSLTLETWRDQTMVVPASLRDLGPMTLVAMSDDGIVREVDLPGGATRAIQLPRVAVQADLVAGSTSSLLASYGTSDSVLLRAGEPPIIVELPDERDQVRYVPGLDEYRSVVFTGDFDSLEVLRVLSDGTVITRTSSAVGANPWAQWVSPRGSEVISDAGGVYEIGESGDAVRVSPGTLIASSVNHLLVRECDETHVCGHALIDWQTLVATTVDLGDDFNMAPFGDSIEISPDGEFIRRVSFGDTGARVALINLASGQATELAGNVFNPNPSVWAGDSSGIFQTTGALGLRFIDRTTGEATLFGEEFGRVQAVSVRPPSGQSAPAVVEPPASGIRLIGLATDGSVVEIDVDSGAIEITEAPMLTSNAPAYIFPDATGAVIASSEDVPSIRYDRGGDGFSRGARYMPSQGPVGKLVVGPVPNSSWQRRGDARRDDVFTLDLVDALGREIGPTIVVDAQRDAPVLGSDGAGRVLVEPEIGGVYVLSGDGVATRLTTGELIAAGSSAAYVRECDELLVCGVFRVDRSSGDRTPMIHPALLAAGAAQSSVAPTGQSVSPDGDVVMVRTEGTATELTLLDTTTNSTVRSADVAALTPVIWSADSAYAVFLSDDTLRLYDRGSATLRTIDTVVELKAIALVPADDVAVAQPTLDVSSGPAVGPARVPF